jgi:hypothetical protein
VLIRLATLLARKTHLLLFIDVQVWIELHIISFSHLRIDIENRTGVWIKVAFELIRSKGQTCHVSRRVVSVMSKSSNVIVEWRLWRTDSTIVMSVVVNS